jgi:hypothetical protein
MKLKTVTRSPHSQARRKQAVTMTGRSRLMSSNVPKGRRLPPYHRSPIMSMQHSMFPTFLIHWLRYLLHMTVFENDFVSHGECINVTPARFKFKKMGSTNNNDMYDYYLYLSKREFNPIRVAPIGVDDEIDRKGSRLSLPDKFVYHLILCLPTLRRLNMSTYIIRKSTSTDTTASSLNSRSPAWSLPLTSELWTFSHVSLGPTPSHRTCTTHCGTK